MMTVEPVKVAVMYDCVGCEYMEFIVQEEAEVNKILEEYNVNGEYDLKFHSIKTDYEYSV